MAWPMSTTMAAAVAARERKPGIQFLAWLSGDAGGPTDLSYMVAPGWTINRTPSDSPEQVSRFAGSIGAGLNITLHRIGPSFPGENVLLSTSLGALSPNGLIGWGDRDWGAGIRVQLRIGFYTPVLETVPAFIGRVDDVRVNPDGSVSWTCVDDLLALQAPVDLPVLAIAAGDPGLPTYLVVEQLMRAGGFNRTPPSLSGCILSVPSVIPEIGSSAGATRFADDPGLNAFRAAPSYTVEYTTTDIYQPAPGTTVVYEGWVKASSTNIESGLVQLGDGSGLWIRTLTTGAIRMGLIDDSRAVQAPAGIFPADNAWHYLLVEISHTTAGTTWFIQIDGSTWTNSSAVSLAVQDNQSGRVLLGGYVHEGVSVRVLPTPGYTRTVRNTWTPTYSTDVRGAVARVWSIPRGQSGAAIDLISAAAVGIGAIYRFREDGVWRWEERASWAARRVAASVGDYDGSTLLSSGYSYNLKSMRRSVTIDWVEFALLRSTLAAPVWSTSELITLQPGETIMDFETDTPIVSILTARNTQTLSAAYSSAVVVPAYQVGDPAAQLVTGRLIIRARPTASGFRVRFVNTDTRALALWNPATGAPQFVIQGWSLTGGDPRTYTMQASPRSREDLTLDSSPWRQDRASAVAMCDAVAAAVTLPAIVLADQLTVSNPAHTVDDIARISLSGMTNGFLPVQIIGMNYELTEQSLTTRLCYPPVGWVPGVPSRSTPPLTVPA